MKVLIITSDKIETSEFDAEFKFVDWNNINYSNDINFSDYDGLIIDVDSLEKEKRNEDKEIHLFNFEHQLSPKIVLEILRRKGSFLSIIGNPTAVINYHQLSDLLGFDTIVKQLPGTSITERCDSENFKYYWAKISNYSYYFEKIEKNVSAFTQRASLKTYDEIRNRSGYIIGTCIDVVNNSSGVSIFNGEMSLIPPLNGEKQNTFDNLLKIYVSSGNINEPEWARDITVIGQKDIDSQIGDLAEKIEKLSQKKQKLEKDKQLLRKSIEVLYKADKPLEASVKYLLEEIGFMNDEPRETNKVEFCTSYDKNNFVVEVKSTKKEVLDMKGLRQVINWQMDKMNESGEKYKPLLVASNQFDKPPEERSSILLPPNLIEFAKQYDICVLPVNVLFSVSQLIKEEKYSSTDFAKLLTETNGIVKMPRA